MVTFGDVHQQMSGKNSNWLSDIKQCIHYKEPDLDCTCKQVSVVMWLAPWPPVRETRVQIPEQHGNLVKFILVWVFFNPSGILTQP